MELKQKGTFIGTESRGIKFSLCQGDATLRREKQTKRAVWRKRNKWLPIVFLAC